MDLIVATGNSGKAKEFREMLGTERFRWFDPAAAGVAEVEETGKTFRQNACLKASAYARQSKKWAIADDSGLEVAALGGSPGIFSARWAAMHDAGVGDSSNNQLLLRQLAAANTSDRTARFFCVLALADPAGHIVITTIGTMDGTIITEPRGSGGFGYDPLFLVESLGKTTAELLPDQKNAISHRGAALRRIRSVFDRPDLTFSCTSIQTRPHEPHPCCRQ